MNNLLKRHYDHLKFNLELPVEFLTDDENLVELLMERYNNLQLYCRKLEEQNSELNEKLSELEDEIRLK
jgi:chaperonin cofactor prefoldin